MVMLLLYNSGHNKSKFQCDGSDKIQMAVESHIVKFRSWTPKILMKVASNLD